MKHPGDDHLEAWSRQELAEPSCADLEEHLLLCECCQARLQEIDEYARVMRKALREAAESPPR